MARPGNIVFDLLFDSEDDEDDLIEVEAPSRPAATSSRPLEMSPSQRTLAMLVQHLTGPLRPSNASASTSASASASASTSTSTSTSASAQSSQSRSAVHQRRSTTRMMTTTTMAAATTSTAPRHSSRAPVIDLTEEPDSPPTVPPQPARAARHPRRTNSQRASPPRLSRSDSTVVGSGAVHNADVIDLTADSPEHARRRPSLTPDAILLHSLRRRGPRAPPPPAETDQPRRVPNTRPSRAPNHNYAIPAPDTFSRSWATLLGSVDFVRQLQNGMNPAAAAAAAAARSYVPARLPSPKPPMEPVPPPRDGFTRDTCEDPDEEMVVVCPSCNEELAYDPTETAAQGNSRKRKRVPGEHHFWAIKKCGHVYCTDCFENRRPSKTSTGAGFARGSSSSPGPLDIRCLVDGCDTKVSNKSEWIGIYL